MQQKKKSSIDNIQALALEERWRGPLGIEKKTLYLYP